MTNPPDERHPEFSDDRWITPLRPPLRPPRGPTIGETVAAAIRGALPHLNAPQAHTAALAAIGAYIAAGGYK